MAAATSKPSVFISYRQEDSGGWAGRLEDDLAERYGAHRVFRDVKLPFGVDYQQHIEHTLDSVRVVIVVIGTHWTTVTGPDGTPRLQQPMDLLRREIERALERPDVEVIPVLVQRARMPAAHELPPSVSGLARRQAIELSDARWSHDIAQLTAHLDQVLKGTSAVRSKTQQAAEPREREEDRERDRAPASREKLIAAGAMLLAACLGVLIASLFTAGLAARRGFHDPPTDRLIYYGAERAVIWAVVGALVLAAAGALLRSDRAGAIGWAFVGLGFGAVGGALGGLAFIALKDQEVVTNIYLLRGISTAIPGVMLASALSRVVSGDRSMYRLAGLAGGLLCGILAQKLFDDSSAMRSVGMVVCEAVVLIGVLAAVATTVPAAFAARGHLPART